MSHRHLFRNSAQTAEGSFLAVFEAAIKEAEGFLAEARKAGVIDRYEADLKEKVNYRVHTFRVAGPASEVRYSNRSILSSAWSDVAKTKKGIVEPRRKLVDYYLKITQTRETGIVKVEFNVLGYGRHVNRLGAVQPVELEKFDRRKTNPFFKSTGNLMMALKPIIEAGANKYTRRLDRLTKP